MTAPSYAWAALGLSIVASILGQWLLKAGASTGAFIEQLFDPRSVGGLTAYGVAALFYMLALRRLPVSVALPLTAATYLGSALVGYAAFGERLNFGQFAGLAVIGLGVLVLGANTP